MNACDLQILIEKYMAGEATDEEMKMVDTWYDSFDANPGLSDQLSNEELQRAIKNGFSAIQKRLD